MRLSCNHPMDPVWEERLSDPDAVIDSLIFCMFCWSMESAEDGSLRFVLNSGASA